MPISLSMNNTIPKEQMLKKLASLPMFSDLSTEGLETMATIVTYQAYPKGSTIVSQNDMGTSMFLLVSGRVKVALASPQGKELVLNYLNAPAHFGEMALVEALPRTADVLAVTDVEAFSLDGKDLSTAIRQQPRLAVSLIATLSRRLRHTIGRLEDMAFHDASHRIIRVLMNLATVGLDSRGSAVIEGMTHYDIATLAGTSRETTSRVISNLAKEGTITAEGRRITVDLDALDERTRVELG